MRLNFSCGHYLNFSIALNLILNRSLSKLVCMVGTEGFIVFIFIDYINFK